MVRILRTYYLTYKKGNIASCERVVKRQYTDRDFTTDPKTGLISDGYVEADSDEEARIKGRFLAASSISKRHPKHPK